MDGRLKSWKGKEMNKLKLIKSFYKHPNAENGYNTYYVDRFDEMGCLMMNHINDDTKCDEYRIDCVINLAKLHGWVVEIVDKK